MNARALSALVIALIGMPALAFGQARMQLEVDVRGAPRRILHVRLNIAVVPGTHAPTGPIGDLFLDAPADAAGLAPGMQLHAVNGRRWSESRLRAALAAPQNTGAGGLSRLVENGDRFATVDLRYAGGLQEPQLERLPSGPDRLGASIAPRTR